jgi:isocitrate/isopropylmalate dehydrogenase
MKLVVVPGDGIGPEITAATMLAVTALQRRYGLTLDVQELDCGLAAHRRRGVTVTPEDIAAARAADGVILGPMSVTLYPPVAEGGVNVPATFRTALNLYANIRPSYTRAGVPSVGKPMDLVFVRENVEDFYVDRNMHLGVGEFMPTPDIVLAVGKITAEGCRRIARVACEIARARPRRKLTIVHKAPVLKLYNGMFRDVAREVAKGYPDIEVDDLLVDAVAALLVRAPERFDTILIPNMFGDILSDEASELAGSLGLAASLNRGDECSVANAGHGSAPDIAGQNVANPSSLMLSAAMLLEHVGAKLGDAAVAAAGQALRVAVDSMLATPATRPRDLGGSLSTSAFADAVANHIAGT